MGYSFPLAYTIGAAGTIVNQLTGTPLQFVGDDVKVTVYGSANATGDTHVLSATRGSDPPFQPIPLGPIPVASTVGSAKTNENFIAQFTLREGTVPQLTINGTNGHTGQYLFVLD